MVEILVKKTHNKEQKKDLNPNRLPKACHVVYFLKRTKEHAIRTHLMRIMGVKENAFIGTT